MSKAKFILLIIIVFQFQSAFAQLTTAPTKQPEADATEVNNNITKAFKAISEGKIEEALSICEKILQEDPLNGNASYAYAIANFYASRYSVAESYFARIEEIQKTNSDLYAYLALVYYLNREEKHLLADLNKAFEYFEKALKLNPKSLLVYEYRPIIIYRYHKIAGLKTNQNAKASYYADMEKAMKLSPNNIKFKITFATTARDLNDYEIAIPQYTRALESPNLNLEILQEIEYLGINSIMQSERKTDAKPFWTDAIVLMKSLKKNYEKLVPNETEKVAKFRSNIIDYIIKKANGKTADYLGNPEYLTVVTEAIEAGQTEFYNNRIDIYNFKKQFAKAEADKKNKEYGKEKENIDYYLRLVQTKKQEENDFDKKNVNSKGEYSSEAFKTMLEMKKSRLKTLNHILTLNIPQTSKDSFIIKKNKLETNIKEAEDIGIDNELNAKANEKIKEGNYKIQDANRVECFNCDNVGISRANYKQVGYIKEAIGLFREARNLLDKMNPKPYSRIADLERIIKQRENEIKEKEKTYVPFGF